MDEHTVTDLVRTTEAAALAASGWNGRGERKAADKAATEAMRKTFQDIHVQGTVVIGEGERDEAPMLYIGEQLGIGGPAIDIAVDPLEGTNLSARLDPGAIAVLAAGDRGTLLHAPDTYMDKIAVGPAARDVVDLDASPEENCMAVAKALGKPVDELTVLVMDRERHEDLIAILRDIGCRVRLIRDGDIAGAIMTALPDCDVDLMLGIGAAPEGVIAAAALKSLGGNFQGRLEFEGKHLLERAKGNEEFLERAKKTQNEFLERAKEMGLDPDKKYMLDELVQGDAAFIATGVTNGELLQGPRFENNIVILNTLVMFKGTIRHIETRRPYDGND